MDHHLTMVPSVLAHAGPPHTHTHWQHSSCPTKETPMIKIGIVDDHAIVRSGLRQFLSEHVDLRVEGEAANGREAIDLVRNKEIDVLLMDLSMPGQSGLDALAMLRAKAPDMGILILSGYPEEHYAINLIRQGASGYLNKECEPSEIVEAIRTIAQAHRRFGTTGLLPTLISDDAEVMARAIAATREAIAQGVHSADVILNIPT